MVWSVSPPNQPTLKGHEGEGQRQLLIPPRPPQPPERDGGQCPGEAGAPPVRPSCGSGSGGEALNPHSGEQELRGRFKSP